MKMPWIKDFPDFANINSGHDIRALFKFLRVLERLRIAKDNI